MPEVTRDQLERGLVTAAYMVKRYGHRYEPLLDRLESEIVALDKRRDPQSRADAILGRYTHRVPELTKAA